MAQWQRLWQHWLEAFLFVLGGVLSGGKLARYLRRRRTWQRRGAPAARVALTLVVLFSSSPAALARPNPQAEPTPSSGSSVPAATPTITPTTTTSTATATPGSASPAATAPTPAGTATGTATPTSTPTTTPTTGPIATLSATPTATPAAIPTASASVSPTATATSTAAATSAATATATCPPPAVVAAKATEAAATATTPAATPAAFLCDASAAATALPETPGPLAGTPTPSPRLPFAPGRIARPDGGFADPPPALGAVAEGLVTPEDGGTVIADDGSLTLRVPAGAVVEPVVVRIRRRAVPAWPSVPEAFLWAEFTATTVTSEGNGVTPPATAAANTANTGTPATPPTPGTGGQSGPGARAVHRFAVPVSLSVRVPPATVERLRTSRELRPEHLRWWQYDAPGGRWEPQPSGYDPATGLLHVRLAHFSEGAGGAQPSAGPSVPPAMDGYATDLFTGWPTLRYPLAVPPGTAGMAPDLALTYFGGAESLERVPSPTPTAQAHWAGYGWQFEPGSVTRTSGGITLSLPGQSSPLLLNKGEKTGAGTTLNGRYHTDPERFLRIDQYWRSIPLPLDGSHNWATVSLGGSWGGTVAQSSTNGDRVRFTFSGSTVTWYAATGLDQGYATVFVDGALVAQVDNCADAATQVARTFTGFSAGSHELVVAVVGRQRAGCSAALVTVDAFEAGSGRVDVVDQSALAAGAWQRGWLADYWRVTAPDGTRYRFGFDVPATTTTTTTLTCAQTGTLPGTCTASGSLEWGLDIRNWGAQLERVPTRYHLDQIEDARGNRLTLHYDLALANLDRRATQWPYPEIRAYVRTAYLAEIRYTLHATAPVAGERRVRFEPANRAINGVQDYETDAQYDQRLGNGQAAQNGRVFADRRLGAIVTAICAAGCASEANWTPVARWELDHDYGATTNTGADAYKNKLRLRTITPKDGTGANSLPATTFEYNTGWIGQIERVRNGYGGEVAYTYQQYNPAGNADYTYLRVLSRTTKSGMTNGGQASPEQHVTTYGYPGIPGVVWGTETLLGSTPGHWRVVEADGVGSVTHDFAAAPDANSPWRPGTRGTTTKTTHSNPDGTVAGSHTQSWAVRKSARELDQTYGDDLSTDVHAPELRADERWSSASGTRQTTRTDYVYDQYGNHLLALQAGDTAVTGDERTLLRSVVPATGTGTWLVRHPSAETVTAGAAGWNESMLLSPEGQNTHQCGVLLQSFTPRVAGHLTGLQFHFSPVGSSWPPENATIYVTLYQDNGADAPGALLARSRLPAAYVTNPTWYEVWLTADGTPWGAPVRTAAGQKLWAKVELPQGSEWHSLGWSGTAGDTYAGGRASSSYCAGALGDFAFNARIAPDAGAAGIVALRDTRYHYDGQAFGAAPTRGLLTRLEQRDGQTAANQEVTLYDYDTSTGNWERAIRLYDPAANNRDDRRNPVVETVYDATYRTFPSSVSVRAKDLGSSYLTLTTAYAYDAGTGTLQSTTDPNGATTSYAYDPFGRLTGIRRPGDETGQATVTYEYAFGSAPNRVTITEKDGTTDAAGTTPGGRHTVQFYDGLGRLVETKQELADNTTGAGWHSVVRRLYRDRGLLDKEYVAWPTPAQSSSDFLAKFENVESAGPAQPYATYAYDGAGRVTRTTQPDGSSSTIAYGDPPSSGAGSTRTLTDPSGHQKIDYLDGYGRLKRVDEPNGAAGTATTTYTYDLLGALTRVTDAANNQTAITYDGLGRKTRLVDPDSGTWQYAYDGLGRLAQQTDAKGQRLDFTYDLASRLVEKKGTPAGGATTTLATYSYDDTANGNKGLGRRTGMSDPSGSTNGSLAPSAGWTYDLRGRVTGQTQTILGTPYTTNSGYDSLDRPLATTYPDGEVVTTGYGAHGHPVSLTGTTPGATYVSGATYSALFQPFGWTYGSGATAVFDYYDTANETDRESIAQPRDYRLKQFKYTAPGGTILQQHDHRYDRAGNLTRWWQQDRQGTTGTLATWRYGYDARDRLTSAGAVTAPVEWGQGTGPSLAASVNGSTGSPTAPPRVAPGDRVAVSWSGIATPGQDDWVGLYALAVDTGSGADGDLTLGANTTWGDGTVKQFRSFTVPAGVTLTIQGLVTLTCTETCRVDGTITGDGRGAAGGAGAAPANQWGGGGLGPGGGAGGMPNQGGNGAGHATTGHIVNNNGGGQAYGAVAGAPQPGSGGGGGASGDEGGGTGGAGGAALDLRAGRFAGAGTLTLNGQAGAGGGCCGSGNGGGGGGGGAGGHLRVRAATLESSATLRASGGARGPGGSGGEDREPGGWGGHGAAGFVRVEYGTAAGALPTLEATNGGGTPAAGATALVSFPPDEAYTARLYVHGCRPSSPGEAPFTPGGACAFAIPGTAAPSAYELRLFSNGSYTRLATSNRIVVDPAAPPTTGAMNVTTLAYAYDAGGNVTSGPLGSYTYGDAAHKHAATVVTPPVTGRTYADEVAADAPVGYWRLDETTGTTAADSSSGGNAGTYSGGATLGQPGALAGSTSTAASLDGVNGNVTTPFVQGNVSQYTIEAWVKTTSTGAVPIVQDRGGVGSGGRSLTLTIGYNGGQGSHPGTVNFGVDADGVWIGGYTTQPINDGRWHHVVGVFQGAAGAAVMPGQFTVYIDGQPVALNAGTVGSATAPLSGSGGTKLGRHDAWNQWYQGTLDEVAVYSTALSATRIQAHYQAGNTAPQAAPTHTYAYDANGAVLTRAENGTTYTHGYDLEGRQTSVTSGGTTTTFVSNGDGQLVAKRVNGTVVAHYAAGGLFEKDPSTGATKKYYRFGGRLIAVRDSASGLHYLHQDHLGSTSLQTSATGTYEGHAFRGPFGQPWVSGGSLSTDLQYTGQRSLEASLGSLYHYQARWYSPVLGRFLQPDTIVPNPGNPQDLNRYSYVRNNPLRLVDPGGHAPTCTALAACVAVVAGGSTEARDPYFETYKWVLDTAVYETALAMERGDTCLNPDNWQSCSLIAPGPFGAAVGVPKLFDVPEIRKGRTGHLSEASQQTIRRYGIKRFIDFGRRPDNVEVHHLVEKRFWRQLKVFKSKLSGENNILAAEVDQRLHGPLGEGQVTITDRIRDKISYERSEEASPQEVWEIHRDVYREFGHQDWAELIWDAYFKRIPGVRK